MLAIYFTKNRIEWQDEMQTFKDSKINSRIIGLRDLNRGSYEILLNVKGRVINFDLPIAYEVKMDSIAIGDSLAKDAKNGKFEVFRITDKRNSIKISEITID
ncbi:MAG: hypothetical protein CFE21_15585 [Bacteroidetes bacterium B1(2017)]|nr:MAG: hypothetical protein CFE21_15585 [Bacteroidetes bacterium B1(2017)]